MEENKEEAEIPPKTLLFFIKKIYPIYIYTHIYYCLGNLLFYSGNKLRKSFINLKFLVCTHR